MTAEPTDPLVAGRTDHHRRLVAAGLPARFDRSALAVDLHRSHASLPPGSETEEEAAVAGRVVLKRSFGRLVFLALRDRSGDIQAFCDPRALGISGFEVVETVDLGDWVGVRGTVMTTRKGELSVRVVELVILQKSLRPLPDKWHGLVDIETRSRRRYLDLMVNQDSRRVAVTRSRIVSELRTQLDRRGYLEVETPVLLSQATGALARPFRTHHQALDAEMYLRIATELHLKRLVVGGLERVYEIGRIFRNEGIDATHNPEFTMLEAYQAFADYQDMMVLTEELVAAVAEAALGSSTISYQGRTVELSPPYRRVSMVEVVTGAVGRAVALDMPVDELRAVAAEHGLDPHPDWGAGKIIFDLFEELVEPKLWEPTFVTDHPTEVSPLARSLPDHPEMTERFELFIAGTEYANAFSELTDPLEQRRRFEAQAGARAAGDDEAHPVDEDFLLALEYGLPPTGGLGIGVDRLVMLLTDQAHIRDVILFPTLRPELRAP